MKYLRIVFDRIIKGALVWGPMALIIYLLYKTLEFLDNIIPFKIPGLGLLVLLVILFILGYITDVFLGKYIKDSIEKIILRIPLLSSIYDAITKFISIIKGDKKIGDPVIVELSSNPPVFKPGFLITVKNDMAIVFLPHSFNYSGNLFFVPPEKITRVNISQGDWLQIISSGGILKSELMNLVETPATSGKRNSENQCN